MRKSRLDWGKQSKLIELFVAGSTARTAADWADVNNKTAVYYFHRLRQLIYDEVTHQPDYIGDGIDLTQSLRDLEPSGDHPQTSVRKTVLFGLFKRGDNVYTIIADHKSRSSSSFAQSTIMTDSIMPDSIVYTARPVSEHGIDVSAFKYSRLNHFPGSHSRFSYINGTENFWKLSKQHLRKFNGVRREQFPLYLKECEWRFNHRQPKDQMESLKRLVKEHMA